jgi:P4 family phage/plasmid primase-like protien
MNVNEFESSASIKIQKDNLKILKKSLMTFDKFCKEYKSFANRACFSFDYKQCGSFENWDIALSILNNLPPENRLCNEKIMQNVKVKPYFDIEFMRELFDITPEELQKRKAERIAIAKERAEKGLPVEDLASLDLGKEDKTEIDSLKVYIKEKLILVFKECYDIELKPTDFLFANCHREIPKKGYKFSFHVVINTDYVVESSRNARFIAEKLKDALHSDFKSIVDLSVYKGTQNFRMVGHCKSGELSSPFIPENNIDLENYLVTNISSNYKILDTPDPEDYDRSYRIKNIKKLDDDIDENDFINNELMEKIKDYHPTAQFKNIDAKGFYQFNYLDKRERCFTSTDINPVYHDKLGFFAYITSNNDICLACHSARCEDLNNKKLVKIIGTINNSAIQKEFKRVHFNEEDFELTDFDIRNAISNSARGLSDLFCKMYQNPNRIKWIDQGNVRTGTSFFWNGLKWESDGRDYLEYLCSTTLVYVLRKFNNRNKIFSQEDQDVVSEETEPEELLKKSRALIESLNKGAMHYNILRFVKPRISDDKFAEIIDIHPGFLSCKNGMVDLRTSELRPAVPDDNITKTLETEYDINADSSLFEKFVREITSDITGENIEKYNYFRWLIGYTLTGNPIKKIFIILYGPHGNNGKSLVMSVINNVLDFYSVTMDKSVVLDGPKKTSGSHSTELAALENSRYAILNDTSESDAINDGQIKQLTGVTDKLSIREIFGKQREIKPVFVPWISTNFAIKMNLSDKAMSNRVVIIPFVLRYILDPKEDYERPIDTELPEKLEKNKEGTLKWLIDAAKFYYDNMEYPIPDFVKTEKESYNLEVNSYLAFIENNFEKIPNVHITKTDLLALYKDYARENGQKYIAVQAEKEFDNFLEHAKMDKKGQFNPRGRNKVYIGIRYNDNSFDDEEESNSDELNTKS